MGEASVGTIGRAAALVRDLTHHSAALGHTKTARIAQDAAAARGEVAHVVVLLHAYGGDRRSWLRHLSVDDVAGPGTVWVFPESGRRWFVNDHQGHRYEDYVLQDLMPAVDRLTGAGSRMVSRVVGGFSMGGAAAVSLALRHPDTFAAAFSYAGAFYATDRVGDPYAAFREAGCIMPTEAEHERVWGPPWSPVRAEYHPDALLRSARDRGPIPRLVLDVGLEDYPRVVMQNRRMHAAMDAAGIPYLYREGPGGHAWPDAARSAQDLLPGLLTPP